MDEGAGKRGSLPKQAIKDAVQSAIPGIKRCFTKLLEDQPGAGGKLVVRFVIEDRAGTGRITDADIVPGEPGTPELASPLTEQCILTALAETPFPVPVGGPVEVKYPFVLSSTGPPPP